jgi:hypothetical protein
VTGGYGVTEAQAEQPGANHRALGVIAIGVAPNDWLALDLRLDGRYDVHPADARGGDAGGVGEPRLGARVGRRWRALGLGAELVAWLPGSEAPSVELGATTLDAHALVSATPGAERTTIAGLLGYRVDRSAETEPEPEGRASETGLPWAGASFDALLLGLGVSQRAGSLEVLGEVSADWLLGSDAPGLARSPLRLTAGVRHPILRPLSLEVLAEVVPMDVPPSPPRPAGADRPRFALYRATLPAGPSPLVRGGVAAPPPAVTPEPPRRHLPPPAAAAPAPVVCSTRGSVVDESSAPSSTPR